MAQVSARGSQVSTHSHRALREIEHEAPEETDGGTSGIFDFDNLMDWSMQRAYQCCQRSGCYNWIWCDKIQQGYTCRKCGHEWPRPQHGFALRKPQAKAPSRWPKARNQRPSPPPGLGRVRSPKPSQLQKSASEALAPAWDTLDDQLKSKLTELGISPEIKAAEPDLKDVLRENLSKLPTPSQSEKLQDARSNRSLL